jgi:hypothetical protein
MNPEKNNEFPERYPYGDGYEEMMQERFDRREREADEYFMNLQCPRG